MSITGPQIRTLPVVAYAYEAKADPDPKDPDAVSWKLRVARTRPPTSPSVRSVQELIRRQDALSLNGQRPPTKDVVDAEDASRWRFLVRAADESSAESAWLRHFAALRTHAEPATADEDVSMQAFIELINRALKAIADSNGNPPPEHQSTSLKSK